jgi:septal ring factor EnvC (AmiA/AmiB activator)
MTADVNWFPLALSLAGALLSSLSMICITIIGFLVKYVLQNTERRIVQIESKVESHANSIATANAQTVSEQKTLGELRDEIRELRAEVRTIIVSTKACPAPRHQSSAESEE